MLSAVRLSSCDLDSIVKLDEQASDMSRSVGEICFCGNLLDHLSQASSLQGDLGRPEALASESDACHLALGHRRGLSSSVRRLDNRSRRSRPCPLKRKRIWLARRELEIGVWSWSGRPVRRSRPGSSSRCAPRHKHAQQSGSELANPAGPVGRPELPGRLVLEIRSHQKYVVVYDLLTISLPRPPPRLNAEPSRRQSST